MCHRSSLNRPCLQLHIIINELSSPWICACLLSGDGTGEGLVRVYYSCVGWPTFLPTNEQDAFAAKVYQLKQQQMKKLIAEGAIPLRDGVVQVGENPRLLPAAACSEQMPVLPAEGVQPWA